jgi:hypothetical protein
MANATPAPASTRRPLAVPAAVENQLDAYAEALGLTRAQVVALGLRTLEQQLDADPEIVRSLAEEVRAGE